MIVAHLSGCGGLLQVPTGRASSRIGLGACECMRMPVCMPVCMPVSSIACFGCDLPSCRIAAFSVWVSYGVVWFGIAVATMEPGMHEVLVPGCGWTCSFSFHMCCNTYVPSVEIPGLGYVFRVRHMCMQANARTVPACPCMRCSGIHIQV